MQKVNFTYKVRKKSRRKYIWVILVIIFLYLIIRGVSWIVLKSPVFKFEKISFEGNQKIPDEKVIDFFKSQVFRGKRLNYLLGFQNFLIWPSEFKEDDLKLLPAAKVITIKKDYVKKELTATILERDFYGIWCLIKLKESESMPSEEECWMFDNEGKIFGRTAAAEGNLILSIKDYSQRKIGLNFKIAPDDFVSNIFSIFEIIKQLKLKIKKIEIVDWNLREMKVVLLSGPTIYFGLDRPVQNEAHLIKAFMEKPNFHQLEYLDFRIKNRLYYK